MLPTIICLALLRILCIGNVNCGVYYIADSLVNQDNCSVNGTALSPCYTLEQLIQDEILPPSLPRAYNTSAELVLLPGKHVIPAHRNFRVTNFRKLIIRPLYEKHDEVVIIKCESNASLAIFNTRYLKITSLHFTYCTLKCVYTQRMDYCRVIITKTTFENTTQEYALVAVTEIHLEADMEFTISNCVFSANTGAIYLTNGLYIIFKGATIKIGHSLFIGNTRNGGKGGALNAEFTNMEIFDSQFINNSARLGGAVYLGRQCSTLLRNIMFSDNTASEQGGSIYLNNSNVPCTDSESRIVKCQFTNNSAQSGGGAIACKSDTRKLFLIQVLSTSNSVIHGDGGFAYLSNCKMKIDDSSISSNEAENGGAVYAATESELSLNIVNFTNNSARRDGGAIHLGNSKMTLPSDILLLTNNNVRIYNNAATENGGGVFVEDQYCVKFSDHCFIETTSKDNHLLFVNNSAKQGPVLYGGLLDRCHMNKVNLLGIIAFKISLVHQQAPLAITSNPAKVCFCSKDHINCDMRYLSLQAMRGKAISLCMVTVDQDGNPKPSAIRAEYAEPNTELSKGEIRQTTTSKCQAIHYHIFTQNITTVMLILQPDDFRDPSAISSVITNITILPCSRGLEQDGDRCVCERRLRKYFNTEDCNVGDDSIHSSESIWLQYNTQHLKVHTNCPLDYCQLSDTISLSHPDQQCSNNHSGVICGGCQDNHSIALGSSKCLKCASSYAFAWLIPVFAVAGLALVALLWVCNMTTAHGTL